MTRAGAIAACALAALVAGCAGPQAPGTVRVPVVPPASAPAPAPPGPATADQTFAGVRFGASRAEVLQAYPGADCSGDQCLGSLSYAGMPASFVVFAQPDGRWVTSIAVTDATAQAKAFAQASTELRARFHAATDADASGALWRWRLDKDGTRQVVLRRCTPDQRCRGTPHTAIEVDFFAKGAPLDRPW